MCPKLNLKLKSKVSFGCPFTPEKKKKKKKIIIIIKVKIKVSPKKKGLKGLSNNIDIKSQKNHRILVKLIQKK